MVLRYSRDKLFLPHVKTVPCGVTKHAAILVIPYLLIEMKNIVQMCEMESQRTRKYLYFYAGIQDDWVSVNDLIYFYLNGEFCLTQFHIYRFHCKVFKQQQNITSTF